MDGVPCHCPQCGALFLQRGFIAGTGSNITIEGGATLCPRCGGRASMLSGTYNLNDDVFTLVAGPESTRQGVAALRSVLQRAQQGEAEPAEVREALEQQGGSLAALARFVPKTSGELAAWVGIVVTLVIWWASRQPVPLTDEQMAELIDQVVEQVDDDQP